MVLIQASRENAGVGLEDWMNFLRKGADNVSKFLAGSALFRKCHTFGDRKLKTTMRNDSTRVLQRSTCVKSHFGYYRPRCAVYGSCGTVSAPARQR